MHKALGQRRFIVHRTKSFHQRGIIKLAEDSTFNPWELNQLSNLRPNIERVQESKAAGLPDKPGTVFPVVICTPEAHATFANSHGEQAFRCVESIGQSEMIISSLCWLNAPAAFRGWIRSSEDESVRLLYCSIQHATDQAFGKCISHATSNNKLDSLR